MNTNQKRAFVPMGERTNIETGIKRDSLFDNPFALDYQGKNHVPGETFRFRVISFARDDMRALRTIKFKVPAANGKGLDDRHIFDPGDSIASKMVDASGVPLSECDHGVKYRIPVVLIEYTPAGANAQPVKVYSEDNSNLTDYVKFLEFGAGLDIAFREIQEAQNGACAFDPRTKRPEYDILLKIVEGSSKQFNKKYALEPCTVVPDGRKVVPDPTFGVMFEDRFDPDFIAALQGESDIWERLQCAMDKGTSPSEIAEVFKILMRQKDTSSDAMEPAPKRGLDSAPTLNQAPAYIPEDDNEEASEEAVPVEATAEVAPKRKSRFDL